VGFEPGKSGNPAGRPPGTPNKLTQTVKEAIEQAFNDLNGAEYLKRIAITDPKAFCTLLGKVLPKDVQIGGQDGQPIKIVIVTGVPDPEPKADANPGA